AARARRDRRPHGCDDARAHAHHVDPSPAPRPRHPEDAGLPATSAVGDRGVAGDRAYGGAAPRRPPPRGHGRPVGVACVRRPPGSGPRPRRPRPRRCACRPRRDPGGQPPCRDPRTDRFPVEGRAGAEERVMSAIWMRATKELRSRLAGVLALAVIVGVIGGVVIAAAAGARRTETAYPRFLAAKNALDVVAKATS